MSAFRFAGCRHPLGAEQRGRDGDVLRCQACGQPRIVREVESARDLAVPRRFVEQTRAADPLEPIGARYVQAAQETVRRLQQAAAKGQVALLVTDAAGVVIVGIRGSGGLTGLQFKQAEGIWDAELHMSGVEILDGSYLLRAPTGWDDGVDEDESEPEPPNPAYDANHILWGRTPAERRQARALGLPTAPEDDEPVRYGTGVRPDGAPNPEPEGETVTHTEGPWTQTEPAHPKLPRYDPQPGDVMTTEQAEAEATRQLAKAERRLRPPDLEPLPEPRREPE